MNKDIEDIKKRFKELNLISQTEFRNKYYKGKRQLANHHFNKYNIITIGGCKFIIDPFK